jgi:adenylate cyclase
MDLELIWRAREGTHRHRAASGRIRIGRAADCEVVLDDTAAAPVHAIATFDGTRWVLMAAADEAVFLVDGRRLKYLVLGPLTQVVMGESRLTLLVQRREVGLDAAAKTEVRSSRPVAEAESAVSGGPAPPGLHAALHALRGAAASFEAQAGTDAVLATMADLVLAHLPADRVSVLLGDGPALALVPSAMRARQGTHGERAAISNTIADEAMAKGSALLVAAAPEDARFAGASSVVAAGIRSAVCAPLIAGGRRQGLVWADRSTGSFDAGHLDVLAVLASLAATALHRRMLQQDLEREQRARAKLARYHAPAVVEHMLAADSGMQAVEREVTVLFADVVGFTALSEQLPATRAQELLNLVLGELSAEVAREQGTVDKFLGDAVMACFGAPQPLPEHALRAVRTALAMQRRVAELQGKAPELARTALRIGVNTGPVAAGDIGAPERREYTVTGDTVNVASRLQSAVAEPGQIVIGPLTYERTATAFRCRALAPIQLRGRAQPVQPFLVDAP